MSQTCPVPTPAQQRYGELHSKLEADLLRKVQAALEDATSQARTNIGDAGLETPPPSFGYFCARVHQHLFCLMCGADPGTLVGGRPEAAEAIIRNSRNIAERHWGLAQT